MSRLYPNSPSQFESPINYAKLLNSGNIDMSQIDTLKKENQGLIYDSPQRYQNQYGEEQGVLWKSRCGGLEVDHKQLKNELDLHRIKASKTQELETKVDSVLKHNVQLLTEKDSLNKSYSQKRTEAEIWKSKYETQMNAVISMKANQELEIKRLQSESEKIKEEVDLASIEKVREVEDTKTKSQNDNYQEFEKVKVCHSNNIQLYEEQNRKLREHAEEREDDLLHLDTKIMDGQTEIEQNSIIHKEEKESLRKESAQREYNHQQDLEISKIKMEKRHSDIYQNLQNLHENKLNVLNDEIDKLKHLLEIKNHEIQTLIQQNRSQKQNFEAEDAAFRLEIHNLKETMLQNNQEKDEQIEDLQEKLTTLHQADIQGLKFHHDNQLTAMSTENEKLKGIINTKSEEIDNQYREKLQQKDNYNNETDRLRNEADIWVKKIQTSESEKEKELNEHNIQQIKQNKAHDEFALSQRNQTDFLQQEINKLKEHLVSKGKEIDTNWANHANSKSQLEEDLKNLAFEVESKQKNLEHMENSKNVTLEDIKMNKMIREQQLSDTIKHSQMMHEQTSNEKRLMNDALASKCQENDHYENAIKIQQFENKKLGNDVDDLSQYNINLETQKHLELEDVRQKHESTNKYTIGNVKQSHNNQCNILSAEIQDMRNQCLFKDQQIHEMVEKYEKLQLVFNQSGDRNNKSFHGLGADLITDKNIYDVYTKSKKINRNNQ